MIADLLALFNSSQPQPLIVDETVEYADPQPREPVAHPWAKTRPANARPIYPLITTEQPGPAEEEEWRFSEPKLNIEPRDPVAHPGLPTHPSGSRPKATTVIKDR